MSGIFFSLWTRRQCGKSPIDPSPRLLRETVGHGAAILGEHLRSEFISGYGK